MTDTGERSSNKRDLRDSVIILGGTFGLQALILVTGVVTARILGPEGRGVIALALAVSALVTQFTLGSSIPTAITRGVARHHVAARDGLRALTRKWWWLTLLPAPVAGLAFVVIDRDQSTSVLVWVGVLTAVTTFVGIVTRMATGALQGEARIGYLVTAVMIPQAGFAAVLVIGAVLGFDWTATSVLVASTLTAFVGLLCQLWALLPATHAPGLDLDESEFWLEARRTYVSSVRPLDGAQLDRILVGGLLGSTQLGLYAAGLAVSNMCGFIGNSLSVLALTKVARVQGDPRAQRAASRRWILVTVGLCVLVVIAMQIVVEPLIRIAFGSEFLPAVEAARWLIVADGFFGLRKVIIAVLQGQGRGGVASTIEFILVPVLVVGASIAGAAGSLVGVGIVLVVVAVSACTMLMYVESRPLPEVPEEQDGPTLTEPIVDRTTDVVD